ncbi:hypothetical protein [Caldicellulosiruptor acetigenus]|uniref:hypothetical protein n=1 Tax=Caldicellulosiruptor acetigenus TaxID=301953 RepID=UPI0004110252|nr:hypothetical protein [Caldicellulosiruptor acetigenus]WAM36147.1 hypothetical protein OTK01_002535 [Caldicellulosiruptor acetigenus]
MKKNLVAVLITFVFFINLFSFGRVQATQSAPEKHLFSVKPKGNYVEILKGSQVVAKILPPELLDESPAKKEETQTILLPFIENGVVNWRFEKSEPSDLLFLSDGKNNTLKLNFHTFDVFYKITSPYIALKDEYQSAQIAFSYNFEFKRTPQLKDDETINVEISIFSENKTKILLLPEKIKLTSGKGTFKTSFSVPVDSKFISFEISQTSRNLISCEFENFKITLVKPSKYTFLLKNVQVYNNYIQQDFENGFQKFTRKIFVSSSQDVINVEETLKAKEDHQIFKEYSLVEFESRPLFILKRDYKLEKFTKPMYVTDSLSDFYLKLENCAIGYANNYDSIETYNLKNKANVFMFLSNSDDIKYFVIGKNKEHIYTTTQLFRRGFEKTYVYSIFPENYTYSIKSRSPNATKAILIFSHHSDSNMISIIKAMMFGTTDTKDPSYMKKGFVGYKIPITWGFFYKSVKGIPGFDNPEYKKLIEFLAQKKIEVVLHTASPVAQENTVQLIKKALEDTSYLKLDDWIDHSLSDGTRSAALKSEGAIKGSKNYSFDLFLKHGYKYCWSYLDVKIDSLNMLQPDKVTWHPQIFFKNYNFGEGDSLYQWNSVRYRNLPKMLTQNQLDKLINENGVCIIHDYFAHPMQKNRLFVVKNKNVYISPQFDKSLRLVSNLMSKKLLWVPTVKEFIDYEVALKNVQITPLDSTTLVVDNKNYSEIKGFTLITLLPNGQEKRTTVNLLPGVNLITIP